MRRVLGGLTVYYEQGTPEYEEAYLLPENGVRDGERKRKDRGDVPYTPLFQHLKHSEGPPNQILLVSSNCVKFSGLNAIIRLFFATRIRKY